VGTRTLLGFAGWLAAAMVAAVIGIAAVRFIGAGLQPATPEALNAAQVAEALGSPAPPLSPSESPPLSPPLSPSPSRSEPPSTPPSPSPSFPPSPSGTAAGPAATAASGRTQTFAARGNLVTARCAGGVVDVLSTSPAQGWGTHEIHDGRREAEADFRSGRQRVKLRIGCDGAGRPHATVEERRD
jgi:hypothetical protein